ncbi:MAG TPA: MFS transporter [Mycobacteriales bacterium]|nr:MFS transporter [Mycobacteriales bacterium]
MSAESITLRSMAPSVFLPVMVYEIGNGAIAPVIALTALHLGAAPGLAGFMAALTGIGQIAGNLPAARLADRLGERRCMIVASALSVVCLLTCATAPSLPVLAPPLLLIGVSNSAYYLARQSYLTETTPPQLRARAMSTLGGSHRIGVLIGPFAGAGAIALMGLRGAFLVAAVAVACAGVVLAVVPGDGGSGRVAGEPGPGVRQVLAAHRRLYFTLAVTVLLLRAVQNGRQTILPLWTDHVGIDAGTTSLIFGAATAVEVLMFYPAGKVMDRYGRLAVALPSILLVALAMFLLPLTHAVVTVAVVAMIAGLGQGTGAGLIFTLAADAAPREGRGRFLAVWRLFSDSGSAIGPVVVSVVVAVSVPGAAAVLGFLGLAAAGGLARWVPRYSSFATPQSTRAHRSA